MLNIIAVSGVVLLNTPNLAFARDFLRFAGSSTVFPYISTTAENWSKMTGKKAPVVESIGTGAGFKNFCRGMQANSSDVSMASRRIKPSEMAICQKAGVNNIIELIFGYDGIVVVQSKNAPNMSLLRRDLFLALSSDRRGRNKTKTWKDVDGKFSNQPINIYGPGTSSGTRDSFIELVMEPGGKKVFPNMNKKALKELAVNIRRDGRYIDSGENDNIIINKVKVDNTALGILGYDYLVANKDSVRAVAIDNVLPTVETINDKTYPLSRPIFLYVKGDTLKKNEDLKKFLKFFMSEKNIGKRSKMARIGLVPLSKHMRAQSSRKIR
ncbi:MAG: substrate-binding domain-containing protein [Alphaproteobacteria bacterium]